MVIVTESGFIPIPREFAPIWKVEVTRNDGTVDDVTNDIAYGRFSLLATEGIGDFELKLDDADQSYATNYGGNETVTFYIDNQTDSASTVRFKGKVEQLKKSYSQNFQVGLIGRHISKELFGVLVSKSYTGTEVSAILTNLANTYLSGYTTTNVNATSPTINTNKDFIDKNLWDCVVELCQIANFDCYVDDNKDFHFFQRNSILNTNEVVWEDEVLEVSGLGDNTLDVKNRVRVYGQDDIGMPIVYTADDTASQTTFGVIEASPISDSSIKTVDEAKNRAEGELKLLKNKQVKGSCTVFGFFTIKAGDIVWISIPEQAIHSKYRVLQVDHEIGNEVAEGFRSTLTIEKPTKEFAFFLRDAQRSTEGKDTSKTQNPNQLKFSYNFTFSDTTNIDSQSSTQVIGGKLILTSGATSGTMVTSVKSAAANITKVEVRYEGANLDNSTFEVSMNGGTNYEPVTRNQLLTTGYTGKSLVLRITLNTSGNTRPELDSVVILFS